MTDCLTREQRHYNMSRVKGKETTIEVSVRKALFAKGFRYRKNDKKLPGKPDIVLSKYKTVIFINGCFWHQHEGCKKATVPETNREFWIEKLNRTRQRDKENYYALKEAGWKVIVVWECEINNHFKETIEELEREILEKKAKD